MRPLPLLLWAALSWPPGSAQDDDDLYYTEGEPSYKYVFYDGDETDYNVWQDNGGQDGKEYGDFYDYEYKNYLATLDKEEGQRAGSPDVTMELRPIHLSDRKSPALKVQLSTGLSTGSFPHNPPEMSLKSFLSILQWLHCCDWALDYGEYQTTESTGDAVDDSGHQEEDQSYLEQEQLTEYEDPVEPEDPEKAPEENEQSQFYENTQNPPGEDLQSQPDQESTADDDESPSYNEYSEQPEADLTNEQQEEDTTETSAGQDVSDYENENEDEVPPTVEGGEGIDIDIGPESDYEDAQGHGDNAAQDYSDYDDQRATEPSIQEEPKAEVDDNYSEDPVYESQDENMDGVEDQYETEDYKYTDQVDQTTTTSTTTITTTQQPYTTVTADRNYDEPTYDDNREDDRDYYDNENSQSSSNSEDSYYEDEDMDQLYRNYQILSEFYQKYYVDLRVLDATCNPATFPAPTIRNTIDIVYKEVDNVLLPKKKYMQAVYRCEAGYKLSTRSTDSMFCQEFSWTGLEPDCEKTDSEDAAAVPEVTYTGQNNGQDGNSEGCGPDSGCPQDCVMEDGYPVCVCSPGFEMDSYGDCVDIDECMNNNGDCDEECVNKPGSYLCACPSGYTLSEDGHSCTDTNECLSNNGHGPCQDTCINMQGYYYCQCDGIPGTRLGDDRHSCEMVDLCQQQNGGCSHTCLSMNGQAFCSCPSGFELGDDWKTCRDINECRVGSHTCSGVCFNTVGSFTCSYTCQDGFVYQDGGCVREECPNGWERREGDSECVEKCPVGYVRDGSGECIRFCKAGYELDTVRDLCVPQCSPEERLSTSGGGSSATCVPICEADTCGIHGICVAQKERAPAMYYYCDCDQGFTFANGTCMDFDECSQANGNELCTSGQCINTAGSYYCACEVGYRNVDGVCEDINECEEGVVCSQECTNTPGSYSCGCREGFTLVPGAGGGSCVDIDECSLRPAICEQGCQNLAGGFRCLCDSGYVTDPADSTKCLPNGCQPLEPPEGGQLDCDPGSLLPGSVCKLTCLVGYIRKGKPTRRCGDNGEWENGAGWCQRQTCPVLPPVENAVIRPASCLLAPSAAKQPCSITCREGYRLHGSRKAFCGKRGRWVYRQGQPQCMAEFTREPETVQVSPPLPPSQPPSTTTGMAATDATTLPPPYIICPNDMQVNLTTAPPVQVRIPLARTNVNWEEEVSSDPPWAKQLQFTTGINNHSILFTASRSGLVAKCKMTVKVVDVKPPTVTRCPNSITVYLEDGEDSKSVTWIEPEFRDNVGVSQVLASHLPGQLLPMGSHVIKYQALDAAGNTERCLFSVRVLRLSPMVQVPPNKKETIWVVCRVGNTGRQIRLRVTKVPPGCWKINLRRP